MTRLTSRIYTIPKDPEPPLVTKEAQSSAQQGATTQLTGACWEWSRIRTAAALVAKGVTAQDAGERCGGGSTPPEAIRGYIYVDSEQRASQNSNAERARVSNEREFGAAREPPAQPSIRLTFLPLFFFCLLLGALPRSTLSFPFPLFTFLISVNKAAGVAL